MNYLEAFLEAPSWIANFGVVPLFLSAAFLFAPIALCLALRRFSVTAVLEAINISSNKQNFQHKKSLNLAVHLLIVKGLLLLPCVSIAQNSPSDIIVAQGEQKELSLSGVKNFSVGNQHVISYKWLPKPSKLLIKGKKVGFTDLVVWDKTGKKSFSIYVLSKQKFLKTFQLADALKNLGLMIDIKGPVMTATGTLSDFGDYLYLQKIKVQYKEQVFFKINLSLELRNHIIGQIYKKLFSSGISSVNCQADWLDIVCFYQGKGQDKIIQQLKESYRATFTQEESRMKFHNYRLKLKIIQAEQLDGLDIQLGLDQLGASVSDLFNFGVRKLILDNKVFLSEAKVDLSSLAEPEILINIDTPQTIEIGSQIPFQNISTQGAAVIAPIDWKFAGLKIQTTLTESYGKLLLNYSTEFSRPLENTITGSKEIASALVEPSIPIKLFQIGFQTSSKSTKGIPLLSDIPVLKHLFESKSNQNSYKQIYGYLIIEKVE